MKWPDLLKHTTIKLRVYRVKLKTANEACWQSASVNKLIAINSLDCCKASICNYIFIYSHFLSEADMNFPII